MREIVLDQITNFPDQRVQVPKRCELQISTKLIDVSAWLLPTKQVDQYGHNKGVDFTITELEDCYLVRNFDQILILVGMCMYRCTT